MPKHRIARLTNLIEVIPGPNPLRGHTSIWLIDSVLVTWDYWGWRNSYAPLVSVNWKPD